MKKIEKDIKELLMENEEILFIARQSRIRPGGSITTPSSIYVTNRRIIWRDPRLLGLKKDYNDVDYRDISNIRLKKGVFSTELLIKSRFLSDQIQLPAIDKKDASQIGAYIQKGMKGALPGQLISERKTETKYEQVEQPEKNILGQLEKLGKLRDTKILTEEEFQKKKEEILKRL